MATIWKYKIAYQLHQIIEMPSGSEILSVQMQNDEPHIWALIPNESSFLVKKQIEVYGTGHEITQREDGERRFIGTIQHDNFVFHVFDFIEDYHYEE